MLRVPPSSGPSTLRSAPLQRRAPRTRRTAPAFAFTFRAGDHRRRLLAVFVISLLLFLAVVFGGTAYAVHNNLGAIEMLGLSLIGG